MVKIRGRVLVCIGMALLFAAILVGLRLFDSSPTGYTQSKNASEAASIYGTEPIRRLPPDGQADSGTAGLSFSQRVPPQTDTGRITERLKTARTNLFSSDASTRREAVRIVKRMGSREDLDTLAGLVTNEPDPRTQIVMIRALRKRNTPESVEALSQCLMMGNPNVQRAAVMGLGGMKNPEARARLREALEGGHIENEDTRRLIKRIVDGPFGQFGRSETGAEAAY